MGHLPIPSIRRPGRLLVAWLGALALASLGGCAATRPPEPVPPGYLTMNEPLSGRSFAPLQGRRILLDPGHGGYFRGAVGPGGISEAEVNLGVALYLRGLLEWAGARVYLTRTADYDFLSPADSTVAADLSFRVALLDSLQPDVFLSLHHNSNAAADPHLNETQTYYPLGDEGASLDLARAIHRHLVLNLEIEPARILPGNFPVLRNATVPAVLGEPSMLSNPVMAGRLSLAASLRIEAQAYFLGLLDYFAGGLPTWSGAAVDTVRLADLPSPGRVDWEFLPDGPQPAIPTFELFLDGKAEPFAVTPDGRTLTWQAREGLPTRPFWLEPRGCNLAGRSAPRRRTLVLPPVISRYRGRLTRELGDSACVLVQWEPQGAGPAEPGTLGWGDEPAWPVGESGHGQVLIKLPEAAEAFPALTFRPSGGDSLQHVPTRADTLPAPWRWRLPRLAGDDGAAPLPAGASWRIRILETDDGAAPPAGSFREGALPVTPTAALWIEGAGILPLIDPAPGDPGAPRTVAAGERQWEAVPLVPQLWNKVVVLDPHGGGVTTDGTASLGLRGSTLNLAAARWAARLLRGAGARVHLTREAEFPLTDPQKVRLAQDVNADVFLTISRSENWADLRVWHYRGSAIGGELATRLARSTAGLARPGQPPIVETGSQYLLRHTACPAVWLALPGPGDPQAETRATDPACGQAEAGAILLAIAAALDTVPAEPATVQPEALFRQLPPEAIPLGECDQVIWDGNFPWTPPAGNPAGSWPAGESSLSSCQGPGLPALGRRHTLELHAADRWQVWLLEFSDTEAIPARLLMAYPVPVHDGS